MAKSKFPNPFVKDGEKSAEEEEKAEENTAEEESTEEEPMDDDKLIDDVADKKPTTLQDARSRFKAMFAKSEKPAEDEPTETEAVEVEGEVSPEEPEEEPKEEPKQDTEEEIKAKLAQIIGEKVEKGEMPDLSKNDITPPADEPKHEEPKEEFTEIDVNSDEFQDKYYENPLQAIQDLINEAVAKNNRQFEQDYRPIVDQNKVAKQNEDIRKAVAVFADKHDDFDKYKNEMIAYLKENNLPKDKPESYEAAYNVAKMGSLTNKNSELEKKLSEMETPKTLDDFLNDDESLESISQNEAVQKKVIEKYLRGLQDGATPQVISNGSNQPSASEPRKASSIREASKNFKASFK